MKRIFHLNIVLLMLAIWVAIELSPTTASSSNLEEAYREGTGGIWMLESSEIGGTVYKPPEAIGLMAVTEGYFAIHVATPVSAVCQTGEYKFVGTKIVITLSSSIFVNYPPGTEGTTTSNESQTLEAEVKITGDKISYEPLPGRPWTIEKDKATVGTPGVIFDTWRRVQDGVFGPAQAETAKIFQAVSVFESQTLADGTVQKPPEVKGLIVDTGRHFVFHIIWEAGAFSQMGEYEINDFDRTVHTKSQISVNFPEGSGTVIGREVISETQQFSVKDGKVFIPANRFDVEWIFEEGMMTQTIPGVYTTNWKKVEKPGVK